MIFDTNILIYISQKFLKVEDFLNHDINPKISIISYIEALGFPFATYQDRFFMEQICAACKIIHIDERIVDETIRIRSIYRIKLPDAIIYATAAVQKLPLLTNNIADFSALDSQVALVNPFSL